ncbi:hypothetical protein D3C79_1022740 [compost metagenome]
MAYLTLNMLNMGSIDTTPFNRYVVVLSSIKDQNKKDEREAHPIHSICFAKIYTALIALAKLSSCTISVLTPNRLFES